MGNRTVLVIEHDPLNTKLLRTLLTLGGYLTLEAVNAEDGIRSAREYAPDCVIIGVAIGPENGSLPEELISAADALLYKAKRAGKNRIATTTTG